MVDTGGPYVQAALICERVLNEQDGVPSAIRIIDRVFLITGEAGAPITPQHAFTLFIALKAGRARGSYTISIRMEKPSGEQAPLLEAPVLLESEDRGVNLILNTTIEFDQQGVYWFDVLFQDERITRIPLRAVFQSPPVAGHGERS